MNTKHYTSIEMSKRLLELGLSPETADMCYIAHSEVVGIHEPFYKRLEKDDMPCWSLGALLELMPIITKDIDEYLPYLIKGSEIWKGKRRAFWYCTYALLDDSNVELQTFNEGTPIEACYNMIVWLLQNNYIKTE